MGIPKNCTAMQAIGYKEFLGYLDGQCSLEEATNLLKQASRRYAKRQLTWFRRNPNMHWLVRHEGEATREILLRAQQIITDFDN
jgi:tRNA dimethylallyltransferase